MIEFTIFTAFIGLIPLGSYFYLKNRRSEEINLLKPFLYLVAFSSIYEFVFSFLLKINVTIWFRVYSLIETFILMMFFYKLTIGKYKFIQSFYLLIYIVLFIVISIMGNKINFDRGDSFLSLVEFLFIITLSVLWFKNLFNDLKLISLWNSPIFYFISGLVLYFSGTSFLFLSCEIISSTDEVNFYDYWIINVVLAFIFRVLLIVSVWKGQVK